MKDGTFTPEREGTLSAAPPCPGPAKGPGVGVGQCQALGDLCLECPRLSGPNPFNGSEAQGFSVTLGKEPPHPHPPVLDKAARGVRTGPAVALSLPREQSARRGSPERGAQASESGAAGALIKPDPKAALTLALSVMRAGNSMWTGRYLRRQTWCSSQASCFVSGFTTVMSPAKGPPERQQETLLGSRVWQMSPRQGGVTPR